MSATVDEAKLLKILQEWDLMDYWNRQDDEYRKQTIEIANQDWKELGYPDPETAVMRIVYHNALDDRS